VRRMPIPALLRLCFAALGAAMIYPDRLVQAACVVAAIVLFAALHRLARSREAKPEFAVA
jgi:hypothetical protein